MSKQTFLIGIAGRSGSGKTELARRLANWLPGETEMVSLDSYYHSLCHMTVDERATHNFDHPDSLDWAQIEVHLEALSRGNAIDEPVYDFSTHTRSPRTRRIAPGRFVILEGILALHSARVRDALDWMIFVDTSDATCLARRMARDIKERGRTEACVMKQYESTVRPMAEQFVDPQRGYADLVVSGEIDQDEMVNTATSRLMQVGLA